MMPDYCVQYFVYAKVERMHGVINNKHIQAHNFSEILIQGEMSTTNFL